jgi:pimeloyl-ACP methyl ester carboxylesterase
VLPGSAAMLKHSVSQPKGASCFKQNWEELMFDVGMTRRSAVGASALLVGIMSFGGRTARAQASGRKTFVLVHGAWHGGWCWRRVADLLEAKGHKVYTPTLTGLGERSHLLSKEIDLNTHIADIVNIFEWEDLKDVCLVPHSYGGWPTSGALEKIGSRVSSIIFVDAFLPNNGERNADIASEFNRKALLDAIAAGEIARRPPPSSVFFVNEKDQAWVNAKMTPQPNGVQVTPIHLTGARDKIAKKTYIRAPKFPQPFLDKALEACKADRSWTTMTSNVGHDIMVDDPSWLADVLLQNS